MVGSKGMQADLKNDPNIFDRLQRAIDAEAVLMVVRYHPDQGHPESIYVDLDERIADEEWGTTIAEPPSPPETQRLENKRRWEQSGVEAYEFDLKFDTARIGWEGTIRVRGGTAQVVSGSEPAQPHIVMTMDQYFDYIGEALSEGAITSVAYDRELGYPLFFSRDWHLTFFDGPGERFWISNFRVLTEE